jgi:hypothetical protein
MQELFPFMRVPIVRFVVVIIGMAMATRTTLPAQQHTAEAPTLLAGPQVPGKAQARANEPTLMSNDSVVRMHAAGLGDDLILQTIAAQPGRYDTDPESLIALKKQGLADGVLAAMTNKTRRQITNVSAEPIVLSPVNEIGVYYKDGHGRWVMIETEPVHSKSSGWIKNTLSQGIVKQDMNGMVYGKESKLLLPRPIEFLIYTPDGVTASEYDLLRFRLNGKDREFRTLTGGVFHSTGGAKRDEVDFKSTRIAPRTWIFSLDQTTAGAEYGILPPGTGNVTNGGKIYTFAISE